jgi:hypothetical protein
MPSNSLDPEQQGPKNSESGVRPCMGGKAMTGARLIFLSTHRGCMFQIRKNRLHSKHLLDVQLDQGGCVAVEHQPRSSNTICATGVPLALNRKFAPPGFPPDQVAVPPARKRARPSSEVAATPTIRATVLRCEVISRLCPACAQRRYWDKCAFNSRMETCVFDLFLTVAQKLWSHPSCLSTQGFSRCIPPTLSTQAPPRSGYTPLEPI